MVNRHQSSDFKLCLDKAREALSAVTNHLRRLDLPKVQTECYLASLLQFDLGILEELEDFVESETG